MALGFALGLFSISGKTLTLSHSCFVGMQTPLLEDDGSAPSGKHACATAAKKLDEQRSVQ